MRRMIFIVLVLLFVTACATRTPIVVNTKGTPMPNYTSSNVEYKDIGHNTHRIIDRESQVICYIVSTVNGIGISCLPISQTNLSKE